MSNLSNDIKLLIKKLDNMIDEELCQDLPVNENGTINQVEMLRRSVNSAALGSIKYTLEDIIEKNERSDPNGNDSKAD